MFGAIAPLAQNAFDLRQDLRVGKVRASDRARRTRRDARPATLTQCRVDLAHLAIFDEGDRVERAQTIANATARAFLLIYTRADRFQRNLLLTDQTQHPRRRRPLCDG